MAGDVESASRSAERWAARDALDADALVARADVAARQGNRERAIRILSGIVDVRSADPVGYKRLVELERAAGHADASCRYAMALSQQRERDGEALAQAVLCGRQIGATPVVDAMLAASDADTRRKAEAELTRLAAAPAAPAVLFGDITLEATWQGGSADLDLAVVGPKGQRVSWLGGLAGQYQRVVAIDATSTSHEGLALRNPDAGEYVVEIVRARGEGTVHGSITVSAAGVRQVVPFVLEGARVSVAIANLGWTSRLVPAWDAVR